MNIIDIQDQLKNFSENQLVKEMQAPSGMAPQFLVLSEIQRRKRVRDDFSKREAANQQTVAQEAVAAAGVPMQGIAGMSEAMAPQSAASEGIGTIMPQSMRQAVPDAPAMPMAEGGVIYAQDGLPRGLRLNNPGNIRPGAGFFGESGDDGGYAQFESDEAGIRAIQRLLRTYGNEYGINTLRGLANRYAPPSDNNPTGNYIDFLSQKTGFDPDQEINLAEQGSSIIPAIIGFEQGQQPFSQELIDRSISAADLDDEDAISQALQGDNKTASSILQMLNPISSAEASTLTPTSQPASTPMPDIPQDIIFDETGRPIGDASYGPRIRAAMETGNEDIANQLIAQGVNEANFFEQMYKNRDPDDLGNLEQDSVTSGMGGLTTPIGPGTLDPGQIAQVLPLDPTQKTISGETTEESVAEAEPEEPTKPGAEAAQTPQAPGSNLTFLAGAGTQQSGLESEIKKLQDQMEKSREQDKWLAIAQAGLSLMSSKEPTLLGAAGEAGISGLTAFREAQDRYQEGVVDLINARAKLAKDGDKKGITASSAVSRINKIEELLNPTDPASMPLAPERVQALEEERRYLMREILDYPRITA